MFKTFPEFSRLTLADKSEYEKFVQDCPPICDLAFVSLMTIWSGLDNAQVAVLNDNLVISYWLPGDEIRSGLSLIGINKVDESLCDIFDHMKSQNQTVRLIHIPQFVVDHIRYPEMFNFNFKSGDEDYIISFKKHSTLSEMPFYRRARIKKFVKNAGNLEIRSLDLSKSANKRLLLESAATWPKKALNNIGQFEDDALKVCIENSVELGLGNVCLFEDNELVVFSLYHIFPQKNYILIAHVRIDYSIPSIFEYTTYAFALWWLNKGIEFANIHSDLNILKLRILKIALQPVELYRKYTVKPR